MMAPKTRMPNRLRAGPLKAFSSEEQADLAGSWLLGLIGDQNHEARAARADLLLQRAAGESIGTTGAFLVPPAIANAVINVRERYGTFRANAQVIPMPSDAISVPRRTSDFTASFINENATITDSQATWDSVSLTVRKLGALVKTSSELAEDATIDLAGEVFEQLGQAFARKEDDCGFNGDGTSAYGGIRGVTQLLIDGSHDAGKVAAASGHDTFVEIDTTDLGNVVAKLPSFAYANAKWFCSPLAFGQVFARLSAVSGGTFVAAPAADGSLRAFYAGFPIVISPVLPNVGTTLQNKIMILFGDLSLAATVGDRRSINMRASSKRYLDSDQVGFLATERVDIVAHDLGDNTTPGPLVGLMGN